MPVHVQAQIGNIEDLVTENSLHAAQSLPSPTYVVILIIICTLVLTRDYFAVEKFEVENVGVISRRQEQACVIEHTHNESTLVDSLI